MVEFILKYLKSFFFNLKKKVINIKKIKIKKFRRTIQSKILPVLYLSLEEKAKCTN